MFTFYMYKVSYLLHMNLPFFALMIKTTRTKPKSSIKQAVIAITAKISEIVNVDEPPSATKY